MPLASRRLFAPLCIAVVAGAASAGAELGCGTSDSGTPAGEGAASSVSSTRASASTTATGGASAGSGGAAGGSTATGGAPTTQEILSAEWQLLPNAPTIAGKQDDIDFVDAKTGWSINGTGAVWHTADGGDTWTQLLYQPGTYIRAVAFLDARHGFFSNIGTDYYPGVTDTNPLYETSDGGQTWTPITSFQGPTPKGICNFNKLDATHVIATGRVGGPSFFASSSDAGATWTTSDISTQLAMLVDSHFSSPMQGLVTGGSTTGNDSVCVIARTTDGGATWTNAFTSQTVGTMCWKMSFPSPQVGYAAVLDFGTTTPSSFLKTTDGGTTWQELPFVAGSSYQGLGIGFITDDIGWLGGEAATKPAYKTTDGGATWTPDPALGPYINRFRFVDPRTAYAIGASVYKLEIPL